jgi:hypothetical protein
MTEAGKPEIKKKDATDSKPFCAISSNRDEVPHLLLTVGAGVTPAEGGVEPTVGSTFK